MTDGRPRATDGAAVLRRDFDRAFAEPLAVEEAGFEHLLAIRVADDGYAVRLEDISGVFVDRKVVPLPSPVPELIGVAGVRGGIVPVYCLRSLLGYSPGEAPRWLVLVGSSERVGLAFDRLDGYVRVRPQDLTSADRSGSTGQHARAVVRARDLMLPLVDVASIVEAIQRRACPDGSSKER